MNMSEKMLLFVISESEPANFAQISCHTKMATDQLNYRLDDLISRGFVRIRNSKFSLAKGVREAILQ